MPTLRSINYYAKSHGACVKLSRCRFQYIISDFTYCQDNNGEYSDYCKCYIKPENLGSITWIYRERSWEEVKRILKKQRNASFCLPVTIINEQIKIVPPAEYTLGKIKGVMYTTDDRIKEKFGTQMKYYTYSFLKEVFEMELNELE